MKRSKMKTRMLRDPKVKATLALPEFAHLQGDPFKLRELVMAQIREHIWADKKTDLSLVKGEGE